MYGLLGAAHARMLGVDIPKPGAPDSKDIINKGHDGADWLSLRSQSFWTIIIILVIAFIIGKALKRPMVKGFTLGLIALAVVLAIVNN